MSFDFVIGILKTRTSTTCLFLGTFYVYKYIYDYAGSNLWFPSNIIIFWLHLKMLSNLYIRFSLNCVFVTAEVLCIFDILQIFRIFEIFYISIEIFHISEIIHNFDIFHIFGMCHIFEMFFILQNISYFINILFFINISYFTITYFIF